MHQFGVLGGVGARVLSEITRFVSENEWRVSGWARWLSRNGALVGGWGGMGEWGLVRWGWLALQKLTRAGGLAFWVPYRGVN